VNALREIAEMESAYSEDQRAGIVPIRGEAAFVVLCWYKHRGRTENAIVIYGDSTRALTLSDAEAALAGFP
jgi:hypothetical protein